MVPTWILELVLAIFGLVSGGLVLYFLQQSQYHYALWCGWFALILVVTFAALHIRNALIQGEEKAQEVVYAGFLLPANELGPDLPQDRPANTVQLLLGDDLCVLAAKSENHVLASKGKPFLTIGIKDDIMKIRTTVMDSKNRNVVRIIDNEFQASHENAFNPKQPDKHSLVVRDADGIEVLNIRFINKKTVRVVGRFHLEGSTEPLLILPNDGIRLPGGGGWPRGTIDLTRSTGGFLNLN
ncbi:MAG: hypothetical protein WAW37_15410 [Syntrophobacteraceae bacterium]